MTFLERLDSIQRSKQSLLCVGLDTDASLLPPHLSVEKNPVLAFNKAIIGATKDIACAYKVNLAFYETAGSVGWEVLEQTRALIPSHCIAIADGKRADIGNSSARYARALYKELEFDAATVAPYMGSDSLAPFFDFEDKCTFVLVLTSNKGSADFQRLESGGKPLYTHVAEACLRWNTKGNIGIVAGATHPQELSDLRALLPEMPFLIPGVGAQGGDLRETLARGTSAHGLRAVINASRSILYASNQRDFAEAARKEALKLHAQMSAFLTARGTM